MLNTSHAIVSLGIGGDYPVLMDRLAAHCDRFQQRFYGFKSLPEGSNEHHKSPYGFKIYAIKKVREEYPIVIWADSAVYIVRDPSPFVQVIKDRGVVCLGGGDKLWRYANSRTLKAFGISRSDIWVNGNELVSGSLLGFDFTTTIAQEVFNLWEITNIHY